MKNCVLGFIVLFIAFTATAQQDSTKILKSTDVIKVGNMTIVRVRPDSVLTDSLKQKQDTIKIGPDLVIVGKGIAEGIDKLGKAIGDIDLSGLSDLNKLNELKKVITKKKPKKVSTNWFVFDIGFAGYDDKTNYNLPSAQGFLRNQAGVPASEGDYALRTSRVSNFNLWIFMQRVSLIKSVLNLKYGFGIESNNYFFKSGITYVDDISVYTTRVQWSELSKNKLLANYLTVPVMLNINTNPMKGKRGLQFSAGVSGGYLSSARQKQKGLGGTDKTKSNFNLQPFKLAYVGELGLGPVKLYGSVAATSLHKNGLEQIPYTVGVRFSN